MLIDHRIYVNLKTNLSVLWHTNNRITNSRPLTRPGSSHIVYIRQSFPVFILPLLAGLSIHTYASNPAITPVTSVGGNVVIGACDSGVPDSGGIQSDIDACVANAGNHGKLVSCVTRYSKDLERKGIITKSDRKAIKRCAAHSSIGKGNQFNKSK